MQIYLPIAEMSVDALGIVLLGGVGGLLAGLFGVGGGFLLTPLLIFIGIPPAIAVASSANQMIAASLSGFASHWRRGNVDFRMGMLLLIGGLIGSSLGVSLFSSLARKGQIDLVIALCYVIFLGGIGAVMAHESIRVIRRKNLGEPAPAINFLKHWKWLDFLPLKMDFPRSELNVSLILPTLIGAFVGLMVSLMGIGGGFLMIPAMIYILGMPTSVVIGTSLFQVMVLSAYVTLLHAINTQTVDVVLAVLLLIGSVVSAQYGTRLAVKMPGEYLRALLAALVLAVAIKLAADLFVTPSNLYSVTLELKE